MSPQTSEQKYDDLMSGSTWPSTPHSRKILNCFRGSQ